MIEAGYPSASPAHVLPVRPGVLATPAAAPGLPPLLADPERSGERPVRLYRLLVQNRTYPGLACRAVIFDLDEIT